tara:strand:- start:1417 stop:1698 length:282 start_codon:yes stop_codon:yes gene_type:complete
MQNLNNNKPAFTSLDEEVLKIGTEYSIGTNDGKIFNRVVYKGTKYFAGKNIMCFETENKCQVQINPSYYSYSVEEEGQFPKPQDFNIGENQHG